MDVCARLGGDEFGLILPGCDIVHAQRIADKIKEDTKRLGIDLNLGIKGFGVSIGVEEYRAHFVSPENFLHEADKKMYLMKNGKEIRCNGSLHRMFK